MALCRVADIPDATFFGVTVGGWLLGIVTGLAIALVQRRRGMLNPWICAGFAVMSVPAWFACLSTLPDITRTFCAQGNLNLVIVPGQTIPPSPSYQLSGQYIHSILGNLGYIVLGALLVWRGRDPAWRTPTTHHIASRLRGLVPMGRGEADSLTWGLALFPALIVANLVLLWLTSDPSIRTGNDSHVFDQIATLQVVLLALAAGFGEELVYRGVMQQGLKHLIPGKWPGIIVGVTVQAVVFAYAHAGYSNLQHLLFAFLFALVAAAVVETFGIWAAIALHVLIDFVAFASEVAQPSPILIGVESLVAVAVLAATIVKGRDALRWWQGKGVPPT